MISTLLLSMISCNVLRESLISDKSKTSQDHLEFNTKFKNQGVLNYFHTMNFSTSYLNIFSILLVNAIESMDDNTRKESLLNYRARII